MALVRRDALETPDFIQWFNSVKQIAERQNVPWLIAEPEDHLEGYLDGCTPAEEISEQLAAVDPD